MKRALTLILLGLGTLVASAQSGGRFALVRSVIAGGGATGATGGGYSLSGTLGQPVAGLVTESRYSIQSGFWITPATVIFAPAKVGNNFNLAFETAPGRTYVVEYTDSLLLPNWQSLPGVTGNGAVQSIVDFAPGVPYRFYRLRER